MMSFFKKDLTKLLDNYDDNMHSDNNIKILEAGCGEGNIADFLYQRYSKRGGKVFAFDISENVIKKAKENFKGINFYQENIYHICVDSKYDLLVCSEVLEHLEEPDKALKQLKSVSNYLILSVPNEPIWRILNIVRGKYIKKLGNTPGHINHWSSRKFVKYIEEQGFQVIKIRKPLPWVMLECRVFD